MMVPVENRSVALGTCPLRIAIGTILIFDLLANNVRTACPIGMGEPINRRVSTLR